LEEKTKMGVQVLSYDMMKRLKSSERISKILEIVKLGDIVMIEGRMSAEEEATLISKALSSIKGKFTGIEIAYLDSKTEDSLIEKVRGTLLKVLAKDRLGITVVGPSKLIKEVKMDPQKLEILFNK